LQIYIKSDDETVLTKRLATANKSRARIRSRPCKKFHI